MTTSIVQKVATPFGNVVTTETNPLTGGIIKTLWVGTQAQYDAIVTKDANTQYNIVAD